MTALTYVFDLDNTLCITEEGVGPDGKKGPQYYDSQPIMSRIHKVNSLYGSGHTIIIDTARGQVSGKDWLPFTIEQLRDWGVKYHEIRAGVKFAADHYIDDKGINDNDYFQGEED